MARGVLRYGREHVAAQSGWRSFPLGAGGAICFIQIGSDGRKICYTDTWNGYKCTIDDPVWRPLFTKNSLPLGHKGFTSGGDKINGSAHGVISAAMAPSNPDILYAHFNGYLFKSVDFGNSWTHVTAWTRTSEIQGSGDPQRTRGPKMAIKPDDPNVVYVSTESVGVRFTLDGGATIGTVSGPPSSTSSIGHSIIFQLTNPSRIWIGSYGTGWFTSASSGTATGFSAMAGAPTTFRQSYCSPDGRLFTFSNPALGNVDCLHRWNGTTWTNLSFAPSGGVNRSRGCCIAFDPADPVNRYVAFIDGGGSSFTLNDGASWSSSLSNPGVTSSPIPWLQFAGGLVDFWALIHMAQCPVQSRLYAAMGVGVVYSDNFGSTASVFTQQAAGIEQMVPNQILSLSGGICVTAQWDRPFTRLNGVAFATDYLPNHNTTINAGWMLDNLASDENFIVGLANFPGFAEESGYSTDGGVTWNVFPSFPAFSGATGGSIACKTSTNIVWSPHATGSQRPNYTLNGGVTWQPWDGAALNAAYGVPTTGDIGLGFAFYLDRKALCKDWVSGLFYLYIHGTGGSNAYAGTYTSPTGQTWTRASSSRMANGEFNFKMDSVPGNEGHLFRTAGDVGGSKAGAFQKSVNGGATWTNVSGILEVHCFGFGAIDTEAGATYPTFYALGFVGGNPGIWRSTNIDAATPTFARVGEDEYPNDSDDYISCISGDKVNPRKCYLGFQGSGYAQFG